jgi:hypothetical protein
MNFKNYLSATEKVFGFRIKTLFPLEEAMMDLLEKALQKYRPTSITDPVKTMYQTNPLGFTGVKCGEVYMVDVEVTVPVTPDLLQYDLRSILGLGKLDERLKVFSEHDPVEIENNKIHEEEEKEDAPKEALLTTPYSTETEAKFEDYFGTDYNKKFLEYLKEVEAARKEKAKAGPKDSMNSLVSLEQHIKLGSELNPEPKS